MQYHILSADWQDYQLLDSGNRLKLEQFGTVRLIRSEPKAWWAPALPKNEWAKAIATHEDDSREGRWQRQPDCPKDWEIQRNGLRFQLRFMDNSKQIGIFPEQAPHWDWVEQHCPPTSFKGQGTGGRPALLNLFGYTGAASLIAARAGYAVTHIDASKPAIAWGRRNQELNRLQNVPIRWILEDAVKFVSREIKRGNTYDALLLDPPSFGRGPKKELWKIERDLTELLDLCRQIMSPRARFVILTMYSLEASALMAHKLLSDMMHKHGGHVEAGELTLAHQSGKHLLPLSLWGRWSAS